MGPTALEYLLEFVRTDPRPTFILDANTNTLTYSNVALENLVVGSPAEFLEVLRTVTHAASVTTRRPVLQTTFRGDIVTLRSVSIRGSREGIYAGTVEFADYFAPPSSSPPKRPRSTSDDAHTYSDHPSSPTSPMSPSIMSVAQSSLIQHRGGALPHLDWTRPNCPVQFGESRKHYNLLHSINWGKTAVGPMSDWSSSLRAVINAIMYMTQPIVLYTGYDYVSIYNLAWGLLVAQERHPFIMGKTFTEAWPETDKYLVPLIDKTLLGETVTRDPTLFFLNKAIKGEENYVSFILSPAVDGNGFYLGTLAYAVFETEKTIKKRHNTALQALGKKLVHVKELGLKDGFWNAILESLDLDENDTPFVILYKLSQDGGSCEYTGSRGLSQDVCADVDLSGTGQERSQVFRERLVQSYANKGFTHEPLSAFEKETLAGMPFRGFGEVNEAITMPIRKHNGQVQAFLILGQNHRRPFDVMYKEFLTMIQSVLCTSVAKIWSVKDEEKLQLESKLAEIAKAHSLQISQTLSMKTKELRESETLFTRTAESVPVGLVCMNSSGSIIFANDAWWRICGMERSGSADAWDKYVYFEDRDRIVNIFNKLVAERGIMSEEFRFGNDPTPGGRGFTTWCRNSINPSYDEDGNFTGWFGTLVDITSIKLAEEYQRQLTAEAVERKRQQDNFIDVTSHELRNPLSAILQSADEIQMTVDALVDVETDTTALRAIQEAADTILACGEHQKKIIDDILNVSKLDAGLLTIDPIPAQPHDIIRRGMRIFVPELKSKGITAHFTMSDLYCLECYNGWWMVDPARLMQVLINLVTNAIKFTSQKDGKKEICVALDVSRERPTFKDNFLDEQNTGPDLSAKQQSGNGSAISNEDGTYMLVHVRDTGIGISKEMQSVLGQRWHQAPKTHVSYGGSGLGLFIARRLCMMLGGELHFDSELGVGSTFSLFFQAARADPPTDLNTGAGRPMAFRKTYSFGNDHQLEGSDVFEIPRRQSEPSPVKGPPWAASGGRPSGKQRLGIGYRVLVVEDNILNQKILRKQLTAQGCETVTANNGEEALEILRNGEMFTIVLMDMEMPIMDGATSTAKIRELEVETRACSHVPIIGTSANARTEQVQFMIDAGMDDVITKPFLILDLMQKIRQVLDRLAVKEVKPPSPKSV